MPRPNEAEFLRKVLKGNTFAILFCQQVFQISQVLDDLYDGDKPVSKDQIVGAFWMALIDLHYNQFFRQHMDELVPVMQAGMIDWLDSSILERKSEHGRTIAFVLRDSIGSIVTHCALLIGGYDWMREVSVEIREHIFEDTFEEYTKEHG